MLIEEGEVSILPPFAGHERGSAHEASEPWAQALLAAKKGDKLFIATAGYKDAELAVAQFRLRHDRMYGMGVNPLGVGQTLLGWEAPEDGLLVIC